MSAATYPEKTLLASHAMGVPAHARPARGFFARLLDTVIAARTEQAEKELARYLAGRPAGPLV
ncbi:MULTISPECIES: hypothetical protein [unclassified Xanthobacter]|uniref:hypothetical protein n=1 Tax=unclassified Xanthobacter TaxID=2623496 RepID=UPI001EE150FD|nr:MULTISPECIES: hypothetical protein [unclassified Xanthobacter]